MLFSCSGTLPVNDFNNSSSCCFLGTLWAPFVANEDCLNVTACLSADADYFKSVKNVSSILLNPCHQELKQCWSQNWSCRWFHFSSTIPLILVLSAVFWLLWGPSRINPSLMLTLQILLTGGWVGTAWWFFHAEWKVRRVNLNWSHSLETL